MSDDPQHSLGDVPTIAGAAGSRPAAQLSLGDERTLGGGGAGLDTTLDDIEIVDLASRYKVEGTLGQGGMGAVHLATDTRLGRKVAIKRIVGDAAGNRMAVQRFLTEAKSIAALSHPHIVQVHDYGRAKDGPFLIMEYVDGGSLLDRCRGGALPLEEAIELACRICDGLTKAHEQGIVHRDIKPANILLTKEGVPKLTDFGLAKAEAADHEMTMAGAVMGTPDFMSPEQRRDAREVDQRSDLWSLAATVYQMVTGRSPKVIRLNDLPLSLQPVMGRALEDAKEARYPSARELRDALRAVRRHVTAASSLDGVVQEGRCTACGTVTGDLLRKFCRNPSCGASLRVACLACAAQIPVWEGVCGECGGNQPALLAAARTLLESKRAEAESLLADMAFDEAIGCAGEVAAAPPHPGLAELRDWAAAFVASTAVDREGRTAAVAESLADARKHAAACDYPAAIQALDRIPERLRDEATAELLADCRARREEVDTLIVEIAGRVRRRELNGLLPLVERAVELRGDRRDLAKLRQQLCERRDARVARARAALDAGDARKAAGAVANLSAEEMGESADLRERARRAVELEEKLAAVVKDAKADGIVNPDEAAAILRLAEEYLAVNPRNDTVRSLAERCRHKVADTLLVCNSVGIELRRISAGSFTMGDTSGDPDRLLHRVTLTRPFYLGVCAVTNAQWKSVMRSVPSTWKDDDRPVESVKWAEAVDFCDRLSALPEEQRAGRIYRLPLEAEWEYACRAGTTTSYSFGDDEQRLGDYAWHTGNSGGQTHPVGQKEPNPWGLFDMHGNVWEWCSDWHGVYGNGVATNPEGPARGSFRVFRGGGWLSKPESCRSTTRLSIDPASRSDDLGLRVVMSRG